MKAMKTVNGEAHALLRAEQLSELSWGIQWLDSVKALITIFGSLAMRCLNALQS